MQLAPASVPSKHPAFQHFIIGPPSTNAVVAMMIRKIDAIAGRDSDTWRATPRYKKCSAAKHKYDVRRPTRIRLHSGSPGTAHSKLATTMRAHAEVDKIAIDPGILDTHLRVNTAGHGIRSMALTVARTPQHYSHM
jgi:hypothetical protein